MDVKNNIAIFEKEISSKGARLIAVSKSQPAPKLQEAYDAGQRLFGENKVQELTEKHEVLPPDIEWHMIGHLQTNKVKYIAPFVALIHSVDSLKLLAEVDKQAEKNNRVIPCLLQVAISDEETKFGWESTQLIEAFEQSRFAQFRSVKITGLMGLASLTTDDQKTRAEFRGLKKMFELFREKYSSANVQFTELSMGMSSDYKIALEEGSTLIRIGTAIFGNRS